MMASSTMYGNVKNYGGRGNHMIVPTGLLQEAMAANGSAAAYAPEWLMDAFGGGLVRIESTTSSVFRSLAVRGAEMTDKSAGIRDPITNTPSTLGHAHRLTDTPPVQLAGGCNATSAAVT